MKRRGRAQGLERGQPQEQVRHVTCDKVHSTWHRDLFLSQTEQRFKSCGVEGDQRAEPCNVHLALQFPTDSILDVLGMVCIFVKLKGKY